MWIFKIIFTEIISQVEKILYFILKMENKLQMNSINFKSVCWYYNIVK